MNWWSHIISFYFISLLLSIVWISCEQKPKILDEDEVLLEKAKAYFDILPKPIWGEDRQYQQLRVELGRQLFLDSILSFNKTKSCNSCHPLDRYGVDNERVSVGDNGNKGLRNAPTVFNAFLQFAQLWDAREATVESQSLRPIFGKNEMGMPSDSLLLARLWSDAEYPDLFRQAFPRDDSIISLSTIARSIGAFERTLVTRDRFDQFLAGDLEALTQRERSGLKLFMDKGCIPCHSGPLLGGMMAQAFAVYGYYWDYTGSDHLDKGMYRQTKKEQDKFVFKVSPLRNIEMTWPYFHDGSVDQLKDAIRIMAEAELNTVLTEQEICDIEAFLKSLTGTLDLD